MYWSAFNHYSFLRAGIVQKAEGFKLHEKLPIPGNMFLPGMVFFSVVFQRIETMVYVKTTSLTCKGKMQGLLTLTTQEDVLESLKSLHERMEVNLALGYAARVVDSVS